VYSKWFVIVGLLAIFFGIAEIAISAALNGIDGELNDVFYHFWVGVPVSVNLSVYSRLE